MPSAGETLQLIEIAPTTDGWTVSVDGEDASSFGDIASAYQAALSLCADLFDRGVAARVVEVAK